jgi:acyl carrier protein
VSVEERVIEIVSEQMGEEEFAITIPDEEAEKIQTVGQAIDYIEQHGHPK